MGAFRVVSAKFQQQHQINALSGGVRIVSGTVAPILARHYKKSLGTCQSAEFVLGTIGVHIPGARATAHRVDGTGVYTSSERVGFLREGGSTGAEKVIQT